MMVVDAAVEHAATFESPVTSAAFPREAATATAADHSSPIAVIPRS